MKEFFTVFNEATDISFEMRSFSTDSVPFELTAAQSLSVGFRKAVHLFYVEMEVPNVTAAKLSGTYENEDGVQDLKIIDETKGFTQSGFIRFDRPEDIIESSVGGILKRYLTIKTDNNLAAGTKIKGIGIVFCNNQDLMGIRSNVISKLNSGNSLITKIELARDHIIDEFNQQGKFKVIKDGSDSLSVGTVLSEINEFDFLKTDQLRLANAYQAMALFFLEEKSDQPEDKWETQGKRFEDTAGQRVDSYFMNLDLDDDGKVDDDEVNQTNVTRLTLD